MTIYATKYNVSSKIENGITVVNFKKEREVSGIIEVKGKYVARIGFNGQKHLGTFETKDDAVAMRLLAEKKVEEGTFKEWFADIKKRGNSR